MKVHLAEWLVFREQRSDFLDSLRLFHVMKTKCGTAELVVTKDDDVFAIGYHFQLKYLTQEDGRKWNEPTKIKALCHKKIKSFFVSYWHFAALTENGQLFMWGHCFNIRLMEEELFNKNVIQVALSPMYNLALTDQGQVFSWMGFQNTILPERITKGIGDRKAVAVACTNLASIVLLEDGQLYCWGSSAYSLIGEWDIHRKAARLHQDDPVRFDGLSGEKVKQIACDFVLLSAWP